MHKTPLLERIDSPADLMRLSHQELLVLSGEIRNFLTSVVGRTGGHLASNLGIVELTIALHRVYDFSQDRLVFDVGHQCYPHKLLTGRRDRFDTLRQKDGITGFPNPKESEFDPFVVGHASTAISSALGLSVAYRMQELPHKVVAIVGDGAIGGGMCFEAMNHAGASQEDILVILNDNDMAIAETVGAFATYLTELRANPHTHHLREEIHQILRAIPLIGAPIDWVQERVLGAVKGLIDASHIFSAMGFRYFGPLDGHDIPLLEAELKNLKRQTGPKLLHVVTRKGHGFDAAANDPETFHSAVPFEVQGSGKVVPKGRKSRSYSDAFVEGLSKCAEDDDRIVAITAAMPAGTGIKTFAARHPDRFIDVGICEAHSVTFAAGLARAGMKPVVGIYSTFLQRGYDQIVHDVCLQQDLPVVFALDRAGLVGADGPTHHGLYDIAFLRHIPGMTLLAPRDGAELIAMLRWALSHPGPTAIRYPRGCPETGLPETLAPIQHGRSETLRSGADGTVFAYGRMVAPAMKMAETLSSEGIDLTIVNARFAAPLDSTALRTAAETGGPIITVEDHVLHGGFGSAVAETFSDIDLRPQLVRIGVPDQFVEHGTVEQLDLLLGLDVPGLCKRIRRIFASRKAPA